MKIYIRSTTATYNAQVKSILAILKRENYEFYGLRADDYKYNVGDICNVSHELFQDPVFDDDGDLVYPDGEGQYSGFYDAGELPGTSAVEVQQDDILDQLKYTDTYYAKHLYLIGGNIAEGGNDIGEIIIKDAQVLKILR